MPLVLIVSNPVLFVPVPVTVPVPSKFTASPVTNEPVTVVSDPYTFIVPF